MDLRAYLEVLRARKWLLLACVVLSTLVATGVSFLKEPVYAARATLFVSAGTEGDVGTAFTGAQFTAQRVQSYTRVVTSPLVTRHVVEQLGLPDDPEALGARISAQAPPGQVVLDVTVTDGDPAQAVAIVNAVALRFTTVVSELERADRAGDPLVKVTLIEPASGAPQVAPRRTVDVALGLLGGLLVGVAFSVVREALDTSIRSTEGLREFGLSPLASISKDSRASRQPLVVQVDPHSSRAESFRQLRTNLQFANVDDPPKSLLVTSSIPGEGKSTTAVNLALTLAEGGTRVVLIEGDLRRPKVGEYLGLEGAVGLTDVLVGRVDIDDAVQHWGPSGRLEVLLAGPQPPNPAELLGSHHMRQLLERLEERALVVVDAPPLLPVTDAAVLSNAVDGVIVVVAAGKTRNNQLKQSMENLRQAGAVVLGAVYNMAPTKGPQSYTYGYSSYRPTSPSPNASPDDAQPPQPGPPSSAPGRTHTPADGGAGLRHAVMDAPHIAMTSTAMDAPPGPSSASVPPPAEPGVPQSAPSLLAYRPSDAAALPRLLAPPPAGSETPVERDPGS